MEIDVARYGPWALIAGGSEGIGAAFAATLAASGFNLVLLARTEPTLERLAADLRRKHPIEVRTIVVDLTDADAAIRVHDQVSGLEIGLLVYNAGAVGPMRALHDTPVREGLQVPYVNVIGQTAFAAPRARLAVASPREAHHGLRHPARRAPFHACAHARLHGRARCCASAASPSHAARDPSPSHR